MKAVSAREANQGFSRYLAEAEAGEEIVITRRGKPVARLVPEKPAMTPERQAAIDLVISMMRRGLSNKGRRFTRDEMHER